MLMHTKYCIGASLLAASSCGSMGCTSKGVQNPHQRAEGASLLAAQVQIDHRNGTVHFGGQQLESERLRDHVSALARRLAKALQAVQPAPSPDKQARKAKARPVWLLPQACQCLGGMLYARGMSDLPSLCAFSSVSVCCAVKLEGSGAPESFLHVACKPC